MNRLAAIVLARRFDPVAAGDLEAELGLELGGRPFVVRVSRGRCTVSPGVGGSARVRVSPADLIRLATGQERWAGLLGSGRLAISGDPFLALRFPALFRVPVSR